MSLYIPDEMLRQAGLTEADALIEFACRLFQAGKLPLWPAAKMAGLTRSQMEDELGKRGIPVYTITEEDLRNDLETLRRLKD